MLYDVGFLSSRRFAVVRDHQPGPDLDFVPADPAPEIYEKVCAEVDTALAGRSPSLADLQALAYTRMVIQEAMRIRPGCWWVPRTATADDVIDGYTIPAGTTVVSLTYGIRHNPNVWEQPTRFDPERFAEGADAQRHKLAWVPFGAGQRQCIGRDFSLMEAQIILAMIVQRYRVTALPGPEVLPKFSASLKPSRPVLVRLERRAGS
jgi:cytochrome P450